MTPLILKTKGRYIEIKTSKPRNTIERLKRLLKEGCKDQANSKIDPWFWFETNKFSVNLTKMKLTLFQSQKKKCLIANDLPILYDDNSEIVRESVTITIYYYFFYSHQKKIFSKSYLQKLTI